MSINNVGIFASQISGRLWEPAGAYDALATVTVPSGGVSSITFAGIPAGYKHLQIRASYAANNGYIDDTLWTINADTTSGNYYGFHQLTGDGSSAAAQAFNGYGRLAVAPVGSNSTSFSAAIVDILDYANTAKNKTFRSLVGFDANGSGVIRLRSGLWMQTSAINSISIATNSGVFVQYSQFALYGVK